MSYVDKPQLFDLPEAPFHPPPEYADRLYADYYASMREIYVEAELHLDELQAVQTAEALQYLPTLIIMAGIQSISLRHPHLRQRLRRLYPWLEEIPL